MFLYPLPPPRPQDIGVQAVIVEYLIRSCELVFSDKLPVFSAEVPCQPRPCKRSRPRSLAVPSPSRLLSLEEAQARLGSPAKSEQNYIEVGEWDGAGWLGNESCLDRGVVLFAVLLVVAVTAVLSVRGWFQCFILASEH